MSFAIAGGVLSKLFTQTKKMFATVRVCIALSWTASPLYSSVRLLTEIIPIFLSIAIAILSRSLLDTVNTKGDYFNSLEKIGTILFFLLLALTTRLICQSSQQYAVNMHSELINSKVCLNQMAYSLSMDMTYFDQPECYDVLISTTRDAAAVSYILWNVIAFFSSVISFLSAFIVLSTTNPYYALLVLIAAIPNSYVSAVFTKRGYKLRIEQISSERRLSYYQSLSLDRRYAQELRLYLTGCRILERYHLLWTELFTERRLLARGRSILFAICNFAPEISVLGIGFHIALGILKGNNTIGDYPFCTGLAAQLWLAIGSLSSATMLIYEHRLRLDNMTKLLEFSSKITDGSKEVSSRVETIEFVDVWFRYPNSDKWVLSGVSFRVERDNKVAIVGLNGSGKTTIVKLLLRLYDVNEGNILINGRDISDYKLQSLRSQFSVYFQEMDNFSMTIKENFQITELETEIEQLEAIDRIIETNTAQGVEKRIKNSLHNCYCDDIIAKATQGLEHNVSTIFDESGLVLSMGQKQKLALARTLFRKHTVLILDEPSSSLDPLAEHVILERLKVETDGVLTIFTSHRLANVYLAHRIIVLEAGKVVEEGTLEELLNNKHRFAELYGYQQKHYMKNIIK